MVDFWVHFLRGLEASLGSQPPYKRSKYAAGKRGCPGRGLKLSWMPQPQESPQVDAAIRLSPGKSSRSMAELKLSQPTESGEMTSCCCFKPLGFGVVSDAVTDNWNTLLDQSSVQVQEEWYSCVSGKKSSVWLELFSWDTTNIPGKEPQRHLLLFLLFHPLYIPLVKFWLLPKCILD